MPAPRVLIIDDDVRLAEMLGQYLLTRGYAIEHRGTGRAGLEALDSAAPAFDAVILDVMLPDLDGFEVCRQLRSRSQVPVLMLTARGDAMDRIVGLELGADDYLPKPFELDELLARLRALLRRTSAEPEARRTLRLGELAVDPAARRVWWQGTEITLSKTEFDLLELLVRNAGIVLDRTTIYQRIWGYEFGADSKNLAVYIGYLRRKLEQAGAADLIHTVRGVGYSVRPA
jgi:two-component system response regulator MprA